jgi:hypothetical protein
LIDKAKEWFKGNGGRTDNSEEDDGNENNDDILNEEIGETVNFTAEGHDHRLWFEIEGNGVVLMVASNPIALGTKLNEWTNAIGNLGEDEQGNARTKLAQAIRLAQTAADNGELTLTYRDNLERWLNSNQENQNQIETGRQQFENSDDSTLTAQQHLVQVLEDLFTIFGEEGEADDRMPDNYMPTVGGYARHHIIPSSKREHPAFSGLSLNINNPENMIYLPTGNDVNEATGRTDHPDIRNTYETNQGVHIAFHPHYNSIIDGWLNDFDEVSSILNWDNAIKNHWISSLQNMIRQLLERRGIEGVNDISRAHLPNLPQN